LRAVKHGLNQTFTVYVFLGDFNSDPHAWPFEYNTVGRFTVLGRAADTPCGKCADDAADGLVITGTVPLTSALLQDIVAEKIGSLDGGEVIPHLEKNLHWRIAGFDGSEIQRVDVPGLKVSVCSTEVTVGENDVPVYGGQWVTHTEVSDGRPGGLGSGDQV
jgi:tyrosinase